MPRDGRGSLSIEGTVAETLPHAMFVVALDDGRRITGHLAGTIDNRALRITPGDRVIIELSPYDRSRGRIVRRAR